MLSTKSFITLFDTLNEDTKSEVISQLFSKLTIHGICNHPILISKYKEYILKTPKLKEKAIFLINKTNNVFLLHLCYSNPIVLSRFNIRSFFVNDWKFYYEYKGNIVITSKDVFPEHNIEKKPFGLDMFNDKYSLDSLHIDIYEEYENVWVIRDTIKWYEEFRLYTFV